LLSEKEGIDKLIVLNQDITPSITKTIDLGEFVNFESNDQQLNGLLTDPSQLLVSPTPLLEPSDCKLLTAGDVQHELIFSGKLAEVTFG
jgi:hypothetical protein